MLEPLGLRIRSPTLPQRLCGRSDCIIWVCRCKEILTRGHEIYCFCLPAKSNKMSPYSRDMNRLYTHLLISTRSVLRGYKDNQWFKISITSGLRLRVKWVVCAVFLSVYVPFALKSGEKKFAAQFMKCSLGVWVWLLTSEFTQSILYNESRLWQDELRYNPSARLVDRNSLFVRVLSKTAGNVKGSVADIEFG